MSQFYQRPELYQNPNKSFSHVWHLQLIRFLNYSQFMMYQLLLQIVFSASVLAAGPIALPKNFKVCSRNAADLNGCLKSSIESALVDLHDKGSRALGVLPIDPLQMSALSINQGSGPVAIKLEFVKPHIIGLTKTVIESVDAQLSGDVKTLKLIMKTDDVLAVVGNYTVKGKVLILPVFGTGDAKIELNGATASLVFTGKLVPKNGNMHLLFDNVHFDLNPKHLTFYFGNLFNGDKALGDNMNVFVNENWKEVYGELKVPIQKVFGLTFLEITNQILGKVPYDDVFPQ